MLRLDDPRPDAAGRAADALPRGGRPRGVPGGADRHRRLVRARQANVARVPGGEAASSACPSLYYATHLDLDAARRSTPTTTRRCARRGATGGARDERRQLAPGAAACAAGHARGHRARGRHVALDRVARAQRPRVRLARTRATRLVAAAERLGYVPNASARTLKQRTSRVVGVVVSDLGNQFYARLAAGIEQVLREADYQMMLLGDNSERRRGAGRRADVPRDARARRDHDAGGRARRSRCSSRQGVAVVEVDRRLATSPCDAVVIDNERGARDGDGAPARRSGTRGSRCSASRPTGRATPAASRATAPRTPRRGVPVDERARRSASPSTRPTPTSGSPRSSRARRRRRSSPRTTCSPSRRGTCCRARGPATPRRHLARRLRRRPVDGDGRARRSPSSPSPRVELGRRAARAAPAPARWPSRSPPRPSSSCSRRSSSAARPVRNRRTP